MGLWMGLLRFKKKSHLGKALNDVNLRVNLICMGESVVSGEDFPNKTNPLIVGSQVESWAVAAKLLLVDD